MLSGHIRNQDSQLFATNVEKRIKLFEENQCITGRVCKRDICTQCTHVGAFKRRLVRRNTDVHITHVLDIDGRWTIESTVTKETNVVLIRSLVEIKVIRIQIQVEWGVAFGVI